MEGRKKILVAPMNWGLGHAARCVPVIRELLLKDAEVIIAADGRALQLLRNEFPELKWMQLAGYNIKYWWNGNAVFQILLQLPIIILSFYQERKWLKKFITEQKLDAVISDNRYGLYSKKIPCILITHQVSIQLPKGFKWLEKFIYGINRKFIERFDECWIPDFEGEKNLSGNLSHRFPLPANGGFIGPLSRFTQRCGAAPAVSRFEWDLLLVISGPENQRTIFEKILTDQVAVGENTSHGQSSLKILMVLGIPGVVGADTSHGQKIMYGGDSPLLTRGVRGEEESLNETTELNLPNRYGKDTNRGGKFTYGDGSPLHRRGVEEEKNKTEQSSRVPNSYSEDTNRWQRLKVTENFFKVDFLNAEELNRAFLSSGIIVARSGYSTIMDLAATGSKAILIPTPGQTEQEYLAQHFLREKICYSEKQSEFDLQRAIERVKDFSGFEGPGPTDEFRQKLIKELFLTKLSGKFIG